MGEMVAFLFADLAGSTGLLAKVGPEAYTELLADYRAAVEDAVTAEEGHVVDREGDGLFLIVRTAAGAVRAAAKAQHRIARTDWPVEADIRVRMGIHVGEAHAHGDGYVGLDINRAARIGALAHGGQVLVSEATRLLAVHALPEDLGLRDLGEHELRGLEGTERIYELIVPGLREEFPPLGLPTIGSGGQLEAARSLAILPFEVVGSGEGAEFLAVGLHNDLLTALSKAPALHVISRTSVLGYRGTAQPIPRIARELNVGTVVEGAVQASGSRIRMTVQLIDASHDTQRWAESYDRELTTENIFEIQSELTELITRSLHAELGGHEGSVDAEPATADLEAYRLVAEGRHHFDLKTKEGFRRAIELFERALEIDPNYATAWVGLADALALMEDYSFGHDEALLLRAEEAATRALILDPDSAAAHASLGLLHSTRQDAPASLREFEHAIRLQPSYADAHSWHSWVSLLIGRGDVGLSSALRAVELDPLAAEPIGHLALAYTATGDPEAGAREARRAQGFSPFTTGSLYEAVALYDAGRAAEARDVLMPLGSRTAGELTVPWAGHGPDATLALAHLDLGQEGEARIILGAVDQETDPFAAGLIRLGLGEIEAARSSFASIETMDPWPCLIVHHYHAGILHRIAGTGTHDHLLRMAYDSWGVVPAEERERN